MRSFCCKLCCITFGTTVSARRLISNLIKAETFLYGRALIFRNAQQFLLKHNTSYKCSAIWILLLRTQLRCFPRSIECVCSLFSSGDCCTARIFNTACCIYVNTNHFLTVMPSNYLIAEFEFPYLIKVE